MERHPAGVPSIENPVSLANSMLEARDTKTPCFFSFLSFSVPVGSGRPRMLRDVLEGEKGGVHRTSNRYRIRLTLSPRLSSEHWLYLLLICTQSQLKTNED